MDPKKGAILLGLISVQYNAPDGAHFGVRFLDPKMGSASGYLFPNLVAHSYMFACQPYAPVVMLLCANDFSTSKGAGNSHLVIACFSEQGRSFVRAPIFAADFGLRFGVRTRKLFRSRAIDVG